MNPSPDNHDSEDDDIYYNISLPYEDLRLLYDCVLKTIETWPGHPARPASEQEHLWYLRDELYKAVLDYRFNFLDAEDRK